MEDHFVSIGTYNLIRNDRTAQGENAQGRTQIILDFVQGTKTDSH